jgi:hypothetical protein
MIFSENRFPLFGIMLYADRGQSSSSPQDNADRDAARVGLND